MEDQKAIEPKDALTAAMDNGMTVPVFNASTGGDDL
jgi:hypothetical protein